MKKKSFLFIIAFLFSMTIPFSIAKGQTMEEIKQEKAKAEKNKSNTDLKKRPNNNKKNIETIQILQKEKDSLSNIIEDIRGKVEKMQSEAEAKVKAEIIAKSIKIDDFIKDSVFLDYLLSYCDVDNDGKLTQWDAEHTYIIDIGIDKSHSNISGSFNQITSIDGIDKFINLKYLVCSGNPIKKIDLSKNEQLETLIANKCGLRELNVSNNEKLTRLECNNNSIYLIDLKNNPNLLSLDISKNHISSIDISECTKIKTIDCSDNMMTGTLSFPRNKSLVRINCSRNNLSKIDVKECIEIKYIDCRKNKKLETIRIAKDNKDIPIEMPHSTSKKSE